MLSKDCKSTIRIYIGGFVGDADTSVFCARHVAPPSESGTLPSDIPHCICYSCQHICNTHLLRLLFTMSHQITGCKTGIKIVFLSWSDAKRTIDHDIFEIDYQSGQNSFPKKILYCAFSTVCDTDI